jgi:aminoglycoside 3-N-acetyltransferase
MVTLRSLAINALRRVTRKQDVRSFIRVRRLAFDRFTHRRKFNLDELRAALEVIGVTAGRTVWVQSSWNEFYNLPEKPSAVIDLLLAMIGPEGTLAMPAIPLVMDETKVFVAERQAVSTGLICELFRRRPGVRRSIHLASSVAALGPHADFLVRDHHLTESPFDKDSPFQRLMEVEPSASAWGLARRWPI